MRRIAVIFLVAVFVPSLGLGLLALRTAGEQRAILERQTAELYQKDTDLLSGQLSEAILARQREFADRVRVLMSTTKPFRLASDFSRMLGDSQPGSSFVVTPEGAVTALPDNPIGNARFLRRNEAFLSNRTSAEFFPTQNANVTVKSASSFQSVAGISLNSTVMLNPSVNLNTPATRSTVRRVQPQINNGLEDPTSQISRVAPQVSDFQTATSGATDGVLAHFTENELELILWTRPPEAGGYVFGLALPNTEVKAFVRNAVAAIAPQIRDACIAVLDENAKPVALSRPDFRGSWKHPFVASEIGETLPHWETALYLLHPDQLVRSARLVTLTLVLLIALALAAILAGGCMVAIDARRQLDLAQKKTDFVSNVSHELKTPLTSIRMFAELLEQGRIAEPEKRSRYLRIITLESERLTRLINNVLDFARMEKKRQTFRKSELDLEPVIERTWEAQGTHLREAGFQCELVVEGAPYPVNADADAIGQILVNLLANAEKYAGDRREIRLHASRQNGDVRIAVQDRGLGVPPGEEHRIFEAFHRASDSLASNVQGSGLGLTIAQHIARAHGGEVEFQKRDGGGSTFTLRLPLTGREGRHS